MISTCLISMLIIFAALVGWVAVQHLARRFAVRHPEFGPPREEGGGCGVSCGCAGVRDCPYGNNPSRPPHLTLTHNLNPASQPVQSQSADVGEESEDEYGRE